MQKIAEVELSSTIITDNSYTEVSPCKGCTNVGKDKDLCAGMCERMIAYRSNRPYSHLPAVDINNPQAIFVVPRKRGRAKCLVDDCEKNATSVGFCDKHYQQWVRGKRRHPKIGEWIPTRGKSNRKKNEKKD